MFTAVIGNGTVHQGDRHADRRPGAGDWIVDNIHFPEGADEPEFAGDRFVVVESDNAAPAPVEDGIVVLGPGMSVSAPGSFAATGVWRFENHDDVEMHEAAIVGLAAGTTTEDAIAWFADQQGPSPIAGKFDGMGALGPGDEAWITFGEGELEAGRYSLMCWTPNEETFIPHVMTGMSEEIQIEES